MSLNYSLALLQFLIKHVNPVLKQFNINLLPFSRISSAFPISNQLCLGWILCVRWNFPLKSWSGCRLHFLNEWCNFVNVCVFKVVLTSKHCVIRFLLFLLFLNWHRSLIGYEKFMWILIIRWGTMNVGARVDSLKLKPDISL